MSIATRKINDVKIVPLQSKKKPDDRPVLGYDLFAEPYSSIGLIAKKKSGKSVTVSQIIRECASRDTNVIIFCATANLDPVYLLLKKWCKKHKIPCQINTSIQIVRKGKKIDLITEIVRKLETEEGADDDSSSESEEEDDDFFKEKNEYSGSDSDSDSSEDGYFNENKHPSFQTTEAKLLFESRNSSIGAKKPKYIAPEFIFVFDDLSDQLKSPSLVTLFKNMRHFKMKIIVSSQYLCDLKPESIQMLDYILMWKGIDQAKIEKVRTDSGVSLRPEIFARLYHDATQEPFSFLYVDVRHDNFRCKFDKLYLVNGDTVENPVKNDQQTKNPEPAKELKDAKCRSKK